MRILCNAVEVELNWTSSYIVSKREIDAGLSRGMRVIVRFKVMECCRISRNFVFAFLCYKVTREGM